MHLAWQNKKKKKEKKKREICKYMKVMVIYHPLKICYLYWKKGFCQSIYGTNNYIPFLVWNYVVVRHLWPANSQSLHTIFTLNIGTSKVLTAFNLITAHTPISAQSRNSIIFRLQPVYFFFTSLYRHMLWVLIWIASTCWCISNEYPQYMCL